MIDLTGKKVLVIADARAPDQLPARYSYWGYMFQSGAFDQYSVADLAQEWKVLNFEDKDLVIINWDTANGDSAYRSDYTLQYFQSHGKVRTRDLLQNRGKLLCECQTLKGVPLQAAYDAIFGEGELKVLSQILPESERRGEAALPVTDHSQHPVLLGLSSRVTEHYTSRGERMFYAKYTGNEQSDRPIMEQYPHSLWFGWFTWWKKDWIPLLVAELPKSYAARRGKRPPAAVMLAKQEGRGLLLASTLWLAGSGQEELVRNMLKADIDQIASIHKRVLRRRVIFDLALAFVLSIALVCFTALILWIALTYQVQSLWWWAVMGVGLVPLYSWLWSCYSRHAWSRPLGFSVRDSILASFPR